MQPRGIRRAAYTAFNYTSALWSLYRAGAFSYKFLTTILKAPKSKQRQVINKYQRKSKVSKTEISKLKKTVREINKVLKNDLSCRTYRQRDTQFEGAAVNTKAFNAITGCNNTLIETALTNLRYWSESTGAYVDASPTGTASAEMRISRVYTRCVIRNNYQTPCYIEFYCCVPKEDTSIGPTDAYSNSLADQDNPSGTSPLMYLTDSDQFNDLWKIEKSMRRELMPGQELALSYNFKPFMYDPSLIDSHPQDFRRKYGAHVYVVRTCGVIAHDTIASEFGFIQSGVDIYRDVTIKVEYDSGGPSLNDFAVLDNSSSFTNGGVVSARPVVDNQAYSKA